MRSVIDRDAHEMNWRSSTAWPDVADVDADPANRQPDPAGDHRGPAVPHTEVQVVDPEAGAQVERGTPGELCTRGYCVMAGYWNDPEKTAEASTATGGCTPATSR